MSEKLTAECVDFLIRVRDGQRLKPADRKEDKVRQFCSRMGFAKVEMNPRRWTLTPAGHAALSEQTP